MEGWPLCCPRLGVGVVFGFILPLLANLAIQSARLNSYYLAMSTQISRREAMWLAAGGVAVAAIGSRVARGDEFVLKPVSMGFIGVGSRGTTLLQQVLTHEEVQVPAVCDIDEKNLNHALDLVEKARGKRPEGYLKGPVDYRRLLERTDINSVLIATPQELHAAMASDAMRAGKFVGSEVPACCTIEECHK